MSAAGRTRPLQCSACDDAWGRGSCARGAGGGLCAEGETGRRAPRRRSRARRAPRRKPRRSSRSAGGRTSDAPPRRGGAHESAKETRAPERPAASDESIDGRRDVPRAGVVVGLSGCCVVISSPLGVVRSPLPWVALDAPFAPPGVRGAMAHLSASASLASAPARRPPPSRARGRPRRLGVRLGTVSRARRLRDALVAPLVRGRPAWRGRDARGRLELDAPPDRGRDRRAGRRPRPARGAGLDVIDLTPETFPLPTLPRACTRCATSS